MELLLVLLFALACIFFTLSIAQSEKRPVQNFYIRIDGPVNTNIDLDSKKDRKILNEVNPVVIDAIYEEKDPRVTKAIKAYTSCMNQGNNKWSRYT